ncbi:hypothetical protein STRIP9103_01238 [Streptomyces ipomoeae 91-03]|uniref:Uncharacterized protein n=1 Tax=Streptomyces ipomoeae 91-03 TaxID=698759 RepID=L1KR48_9ACTN|nr:hypothetical protein STRIP9103_01238 [Streptomyces ipomoeae 91-03]
MYQYTSLCFRITIMVLRDPEYSDRAIELASIFLEGPPTESVDPFAFRS